jgi:hypothetical protein
MCGLHRRREPGRERICEGGGGKSEPSLGSEHVWLFLFQRDARSEIVEQSGILAQYQDECTTSTEAMYPQSSRSEAPQRKWLGRPGGWICDRRPRVRVNQSLNSGRARRKLWRDGTVFGPGRKCLSWKHSDEELCAEGAKRGLLICTPFCRERVELT